MNEILKDDQYYVDMYYTYGAIEWLRTSPSIIIKPVSGDLSIDIWILLIKMQRYIQGVNHNIGFAAIIPHEKNNISSVRNSIDKADKKLTQKVKNQLAAFFKPFQPIFIKAKDYDTRNIIFTSMMQEQISQALENNKELAQIKALDIIECYRYIGGLEAFRVTPDTDIKHIRNRNRQIQKNTHGIIEVSRCFNSSNFINTIAKTSHDAFIDLLKNKRDFINKLVELDYEFCKKNNYKVYRKTLAEIKQSVENPASGTYNLARISAYRNSRIAELLSMEVQAGIENNHIDRVNEYLAIYWIKKMYLSENNIDEFCVLP